MNRVIHQTKYLTLLTCVALLSACATIKGPTEAAESAEQRAFALYGTVVVFEEQGAALINDSRVDLSVRRAIQQADRVAKPIADSTLEVALELKQVREELGDENRLASLTANLESWIARLEPAVASLVSAIRSAT